MSPWFFAKEAEARIGYNNLSQPHNSLFKDLRPRSSTVKIFLHSAIRDARPELSLGVYGGVQRESTNEGGVRLLPTGFCAQIKLPEAGD